MNIRDIEELLIRLVMTLDKLSKTSHLSIQSDSEVIKLSVRRAQWS